MAISCSECEGHQDIACPDCGKDYYLRDTEAQAEIARLQAEVERLNNLNRQRAEDMITMGEDTNKLCREYEVRGFNAGIEAAAEKLVCECHDDMTREEEANEIRALKRPASEVSNG